MTCAQKPKENGNTRKSVKTPIYNSTDWNENGRGDETISETDEESEIKCGQKLPKDENTEQTDTSGNRDETYNSHTSSGYVKNVLTEESIKWQQDAVSNEYDPAKEYDSIYTKNTEILEFANSALESAKYNAQPLSIIPSYTLEVDSYAKSSVLAEIEENGSQFRSKSADEPNTSGTYKGKRKRDLKGNGRNAVDRQVRKHNVEQPKTKHTQKKKDKIKESAAMSLFDKLKNEPPNLEESKSELKIGSPDLFSMKNTLNSTSKPDVYDTLPHALVTNDIEIKTDMSNVTQNKKQKPTLTYEMEASNVTSSTENVPRKRKLYTSDDISLVQSGPRLSKMRTCRNKLQADAYKENDCTQVELTSSSIYYSNKNEINDTQKRDQVIKNVRKLNRANNRPSSHSLADPVIIESKQVPNQTVKPSFSYRNAGRTNENANSADWPLHPNPAKCQNTGGEEKVSDEGPYVDFQKIMAGFKRPSDPDSSLSIRASYSAEYMPLSDLDDDDDLIIVDNDHQNVVEEQNSHLAAIEAKIDT